MPAPQFSVVIPTYARPHALAGCLQALADQELSREAFEVIVVDDASPVAPAAVVSPFQDRLALALFTVAHGGPAAARNRGVAHARGTFLAFTDDDCRPAPGWLQALAARFRAVPEHLIGGRTVNALQANPYAVTSQLIIDVAYAHYNPDAGDARFFSCNNLAVAADRFRELGGFDPEFTTAEDREFCDRWVHAGYRMTYAPEAVIPHAHPLTLRRFWRQHFGYGRGAWRFHQMRMRRGAGRFRPDVHFYTRLGAAPFRRLQRHQIPRTAALLLVAQVANGAGFLYERRRLTA